MATRTKLDRAGRRYPSAAWEARIGQRPPNYGKEYPPDPPTREEVLRVAAHAGDDATGWRAKAVIGLLGSGLTISEVLAIDESAVDGDVGTVKVPGRHAREAKLDPWAVEQILGWLPYRYELPVGPLLCVLHGPTMGDRWSSAGVRNELHALAAAAGVGRRFAPHQLRYTCALEWLARGSSPQEVFEQLGLASSGDGRNHRTMIMLKTAAAAMA